MTTACADDRGPGPCTNTHPHTPPKGCVHESTTGSWVNDHHTEGGHG